MHPMMIHVTWWPWKPASLRLEHPDPFPYWSETLGRHTPGKRSRPWQEMQLRWSMWGRLFEICSLQNLQSLFLQISHRAPERCWCFVDPHVRRARSVSWLRGEPLNSCADPPNVDGLDENCVAIHGKELCKIAHHQEPNMPSQPDQIRVWRITFWRRRRRVRVASLRSSRKLSLNLRSCLTPNSNHVSIQRCVDFLLRGSALEPEEHEYLLHCLEWMEAMMQAASQELKRMKDTEE